MIRDILTSMLILTTCMWLIYELYILMHQGKLIIRVDQSKGTAILYMSFLVFWIMQLALNTNSYMFNKNIMYIKNNVININGIVISIMFIIRVFRNKEIRENGIYNESRFYRWSEVKSYNWIEWNTIKFRVNTFFKTDKSFELTIKEELKSIVDEALQKHINL